MSTVRVHHVTPDHRASTSGIIFGAEINAFLDAGTVLIDPGRLAVDPDLLGDDLRALPYLTLRRHGLRIFLRRPLPDCVPYASHGLLQADLPIGNRRGAAENLGIYNADGAFLVAQVRGQRTSILDHYPIFDSEPFERRLMFAGREVRSRH